MKFISNIKPIIIFVGFLSLLTFVVHWFHAVGFSFSIDNLPNLEFLAREFSSFLLICFIVSIMALTTIYVIETRSNNAENPEVDDNKKIKYYSSNIAKNNTSRVEYRSFNLRKAINDTARKISSRILDKDIEMLVDVQADIPCNFIGDANRLCHVLTNLLSNAVKFTQAGHIIIRVGGQRDTDNHWQLQFSIEDTGIGITPAELESIRTAFSLLNGESGGEKKTSCLGLAITARLVSLMGGSIGVYSNKDEGSHFWFNLEMMSASTQLGISHLKSFRDVQVLIVDDNPHSQEFLKQQMKYWGAECVSCNNEREALSFLQACEVHKCPVKMIILDYKMPGMNGADLLSEIRRMSTYYETPVILLSSVDYMGNQSPFLHEGLHSVLNKPFSRDDLFDAIASAITPITQEDKAAVEAARQIASFKDNNATSLEYKAFLMGGKAKPRLKLVKNNSEAA